MIKLINTEEFDKLTHDRKRIVMKGSEKLENQIKLMADEFYKITNNNPLIHDEYKGFYIYKYSTKGFSLRILYRYKNNVLELHKFHFKKGDRSQTAYFETFKKYVDDLEK